VGESKWGQERKLNFEIQSFLEKEDDSRAAAWFKETITPNTPPILMNTIYRTFAQKANTW
jgi:hypothetical protein